MPVDTQTHPHTQNCAHTHTDTFLDVHTCGLWRCEVHMEGNLMSHS